MANTRHEGDPEQDLKGLYPRIYDGQEAPKPIQPKPVKKLPTGRAGRIAADKREADWNARKTNWKPKPQFISEESKSRHLEGMRQLIEEGVARSSGNIAVMGESTREPEQLSLDDVNPDDLIIRDGTEPF